jgi:hypothetical protein
MNKLPSQKTPTSSIHSHISVIYKKILPVILIFVLVMFVLGFRFRNNSTKESWINYMNLPFGEVKTGVDSPVGFYIRPEYRLPYRWPLGIKTSYPITHVAPFMN